MQRALKLLVLGCLWLALAAPVFAKPNNRGMVQGGPNGMTAAQYRQYQYFLARNRGRRGPTTGYGYGAGPIFDARSFGYTMPGF